MNTSKITLLILFLGSLLTNPNQLFAQAPENINYQAVIRDNSTTPATLVANQAIGLEFQIMDQNNSVVYTETHSPMTNAQGLINLKLGTGQSSGNFANINWGQGSYTLQTAVDLSGGTNYAVLGSSALSSVPYALQAANSRLLSDPARDTRIETANHQLTFSTASNPAMTIDSLQHVGIGIATPEHRLDIRDNGAALGVQALNSEQATFAEFKNHNATTTGVIGIDGQGLSNTPNQFSLGSMTQTPVGFYTNGLQRMVLDANGRLGIGQPAPNATLDVNGSLRLTDGNQGAGKVLTSDVSGNASWQDLPPQSGVNLPTGVIVMWAGTAPPAGWAICDGSNGTPDLRGRFVLGAGQGAGLTNRPSGTTGGQEQVTLTTAEMPAHSHGINDPGHSHTWSASRQLAGTDDNNNTTEFSRGDLGTVDFPVKSTTVETTGITLQNEGGGAPHENMPPFYVMAYIMKL